MANLSIPEITRDSKEYRSELLVNKVFSKDGKENNFMSDQGLFIAEKLYIQKKEYKYSKDLYKLILALKGQRGASVELHGKLAGKSVSQMFNITQIEKGEEFGGQPTGGKKENKGNLFERQLYNRLQECITGQTCTGPYARQAKKIVELTSKNKGSPVVHVEHAGGANTSRPLILEGGNPIIAPNNPVEHGAKLTDITLKHKNGQYSYLSLKFSSTVTAAIERQVAFEKFNKCFIPMV